jgi:fido (protein-threonine AMPylation protein)
MSDKSTSCHLLPLVLALPVINESLDDRTTLGVPFAGTFKTSGDLFKKYLEFDFQTLLKPFRIAHIHLLHRILLVGIKPAQKCGHFRKKGVHVSNPDLLFPPAEAVPSLMEEFCNDFPSFARLPGRDNILLAATFSFRFVRIHPYGDGNGRVSRLLMNLILLSDDLPVYLKADKKGRHRYSQALRRADRGNLHPLASLIALSLKEIYGKALASIERGIPSKSAHSSQSVASDGASLAASEIASKPQ